MGDFLVKCWRGEERLWKVFWGCGVAPSLILVLLVSRTAESVLIEFLVFVSNVASVPVESFELLFHYFFFLFLFLIVVYSTWLFVSVWRCAPNVKWQLWRKLARINTVFGVVTFYPGIISILLETLKTT